MNTSETLKTISERLIRENICHVPLNEKSLNTISEYMRLRNAGSELMRRLSNVEMNYVQIHSEAEDAHLEAMQSKATLIRSFKSLIDIWSSKGYLKDFVFSFKEEDTESMRADFSLTLESISITLNTFSKALITLSETSAQMRACSASFMEIYHDSKLAIYASALNRDKEEILDCRAISLQAHASANESSRASARYLGLAKNCTRIYSLVNSLIAESSGTLYSNISGIQRNRLFSPTLVAKNISEAIRNLEYINIENN